MKRNDAEFKAEIFRRFDVYKKKRKNRCLAAGGTCLMFLFCVGALWTPIVSYLDATPSETTQTRTESTPTTLTDVTDGGAGSVCETIDPEGTYLPPCAMTVTYGEKTWTFDDPENAEAVLQYARDHQSTYVYDNVMESMTVTTEATTSAAIASCDEELSHFAIEVQYESDGKTQTATYILTEPRWNFEELEEFLNDLAEE